MNNLDVRLLLPAYQDILAGPAQLVILGTGEPAYELQLQELAARHPGGMAVILSYNESRAHRPVVRSDQLATVAIDRHEPGFFLATKRQTLSGAVWLRD